MKNPLCHNVDYPAYWVVTYMVQGGKLWAIVYVARSLPSESRNIGAKWLISVRPVASDHTSHFHRRCVQATDFVAPLLHFESDIWHFRGRIFSSPAWIYCVDLRVSQTRVRYRTNTRLCMMDVKGYFPSPVKNIDFLFYYIFFKFALLRIFCWNSSSGSVKQLLVLGDTKNAPYR